MPLNADNQKPPHNLGPWRNFLTFVWNPQRKAFMGRTARNWGTLLLFYLLFIASLAAVVALMGWIVLANINRYNTPWWQMKASRIGTSPGLGFRPVLHLTSPLIWYKWNTEEMTYKAYVKEMDKFLQSYQEFNPDEHEDCSKDILPRKRNKPCYFNVSQLHQCASPEYGYDQMAPCIYIKLNKIYGWVPECYNETSSIPGDMPHYLQTYITDSLGGKVHEMNTVWLSCNGYFPADSQHMGEIDFFPRPGFKAVYFPYLGQKGYQSPLVAIKFREPMRNTLITVRCRVWAHNIVDSTEGDGPVDFQLMIGDKY